MKYIEFTINIKVPIKERKKEGIKDKRVKED